MRVNDTSSFTAKRKHDDFMSEPGARRPRKRLFIGLVTATCVLLCLLLLVGWIIPVVGLGNIHPVIPHITGIVLVACIGIIALAALSLIVQIMTGLNMWGSLRIRGLVNRLFLPCMEIVARFVGISASEVRSSFIKVNNELIRNLGTAFPPDRILLLLPHCLQWAECEIRLTAHVDACKRCGRCPIDGLLSLRDQYGVCLAIAAGGSIARRIVVEARPSLIIAVACERDLTSGVQDTHPLPVYGILNYRPHGPCRNTVVTLSLVENALRRFIAPALLPTQRVTEPE
jgi:hypothetical protein